MPVICNRVNSEKADKRVSIFISLISYHCIYDTMDWITCHEWVVSGCVFLSISIRSLFYLYDKYNHIL